MMYILVCIAARELPCSHIHVMGCQGCPKSYMFWGFILNINGIPHCSHAFYSLHWNDHNLFRPTL
jgi:hypothetical protein